MKKLLLGITLLSTLSLGTASANSCDPLPFSEVTAEQAAEQFITSKAKAKKILKVEATFTKNFLTKSDKAAIALIKLIDPIIYELEKDCLESSNEKYAVNVVYEDALGKECTQDLEVKLQSKLRSNGYKSTVKKTTHPVCL